MPPQLLKYGPFLAGVCAGVLVAILAGEHAAKLAVGLSAVGTALGVIVAGFTATQRSMLLVMVGSKILRHLARARYDEDALSYLGQTIYLGVVVSVLSVSGIFLPSHHSVWLGCFVGVASAMFLTLLRNEMIMGIVIGRFLKDQDRGNG